MGTMATNGITAWRVMVVYIRRRPNEALLPNCLHRTVKVVVAHG